MTQNISKDKIISIVAICGTILLMWFFMMNTNFYITSTSNHELPNNLISHTIAVQWDWEVFATPDMLILSISVEETKPTTQAAQTEVNKKISQIKDILDNNKIKNSDVQTQNISVYPEYNYKRDEERTLKWYRARHSLQITIKDANLENDGVWWQIIDEVSKIWWVRINNVNYDIEDKTPYYTQARKLAMKKANQKAKELASVAWVSLLKPISISENLNTYYPPMPMYKNTYEMDMGVGSDEEMRWWADISLWELTINLNINVIYWID